MMRVGWMVSKGSRYSAAFRPRDTIVMLQSRNMGFFSNLMENLKREADKEEDFKKDLKDLKEHEVTQKIKSTSKTVAGTATSVGESVARVVKEDVLDPTSKTAKKFSEPVAKTVVGGAKIVASTATRVAEHIDERVEKVKSTKTYQRTTASLDRAAKAAEASPMGTIVKSTRAALEEERRQSAGGQYFDEPPEDVRIDLVNEEDLNTDELGIVVADTKSAWERQLESLASGPTARKILQNPVIGGLVRGVGSAVEKAGNVSDAVGEKLFPVSEGGDAIGRIRARDPKFNLYGFIDFLKDKVCAEVIQAFLNGDLVYLKKKCGDKAYAVLSASIKAREVAGLYPDTRILNITNVEFQKAILSEEEVPTILVSFVVQQVHAQYNTKKELVEGSENDIRAFYYVWALQPDPKFADLRWRIAEFAIHGSLKLLS